MNQKLKHVLGYAVLVLTLLVLLFLPLPVYLDSPGAAQDVSSYVKVNGQKDKQPGQFMLVYIKQAKATPLSWALSFTNKYATRTSAKEEVGDYSDREMAKIQNYYMSSSVAEAKYQSLSLAHQKVKRQYLGMYVMSVLKKSNFAGNLKVGDVVNKVAGKSYSSSAAYMRALQQMPPRKDVTIEYQRGRKQGQAHGRLIRLPQTKRYGLGITLTDRVKTISSVPITANMQGIGGPSAGLMLTLQMYSQLTQQDLLKGRKIAGTGTIEADGHVGQIGGVEQKVVAASRAKASIFFVPNDPQLKKDNNYQAALKTAHQLKTKLKVVPVSNVSQAVNYLKN